MLENLTRKTLATNWQWLLWQVVLRGSNANNSLNTGAFYWNSNNTSSNSEPNIAGHLSLCITSVIATTAMPLGKTQSNAPSVLVGEPNAPG